MTDKNVKKLKRLLHKRENSFFKKHFENTENLNEAIYEPLKRTFKKLVTVDISFQLLLSSFQRLKHTNKFQDQKKVIFCIEKFRNIVMNLNLISIQLNELVSYLNCK